MDDKTFDSWTRALLRDSSTRRSILQAITAGGTGFALSELGLEEAAAKKKNKKKKKKRPGQCPANKQYCAAPGIECGPQCDCGTDGDGEPFCADSAHCFNPQCASDADCTGRGLPAGTVCGDGTGGFCNPCTKVCLTPCGSCPGGSC